jgi:GNAT superfamily N-acetyltransferase
MHMPCVLRHVLPDDAPRLAALCERLSDTTRRRRFFDPCRRLSCQEAERLACVDHARHEALVIADGDRLVGLGQCDQLGDQPVAEITVLVEDAYQGQGLGRQLVRGLIDTARQRGYRILLAELLPDNEPMLHVLETAGPSIVVDPYFGLLRVTLLLNA